MQNKTYKVTPSSKSKDVNRMDALIKYLYNLEEGIELYALMEKHWILEMPVAPLSMSARYTDQREGQNQIIRYIKNIAYPVLKKESKND